MFNNGKVKFLLEKMPVFAVGLLTGSSFLAFFNSEWYLEQPVFLPFLGFLAVLCGGWAGKTVRNMNPALLAILAGGVLIVNYKGATGVALLLCLALWAMLAIRKNNRLWLAAGILPGCFFDFGVDIRFRLLLWGWLIALPAVLLAGREFLHWRTWGAMLLCGGLLMMLPLASSRKPLYFPASGALPVLLLPEAENLNIALVTPSGSWANSIKKHWETYPFVKKVTVGTEEILQEEFDLIVFDRLPGHTATSNKVLLERSLQLLSPEGAFVFRDFERPEGYLENQGFPVPGTMGKYTAILKNKGQRTLSEMDKTLQAHLKTFGLENAFMPPGVFKALFYEDVHFIRTVYYKNDWNWFFKAGGILMLAWILFTLVRTGMDGSVWGNGCWFGLFGTVLICRSADWEFSHPLLWYFLPLVLFAGFLLTADSGRVGRYALGISLVLPLGMFLPLANWGILPLAAVAAACCGSVFGALAARTPEKSGVLFCKYAAGSVGGVLIYCASESIFPGNPAVIAAVLTGVRIISFFRF